MRVKQKNAVISPADAAVLLGKSRQTVVNMIKLYTERTEGDTRGWLYGWKQGSHYKTTQQAVRAYNNGIYNYEPIK